MHESHRYAAERHELAARAHRTAAEHHEKGDLPAAAYHQERALEYSDHAWKLSQAAHDKSSRMETLQDDVSNLKAATGTVSAASQEEGA